MKLTVLGCGSFFVSANQTASAFLLETAGKKILIDCGPGTLVRLSEQKVKLEDIDYVFLTHFHPDHSSDLFPLFMNYKLTDFFTPGTLTKFPEFFGPEGFDKFFLDYSHLCQLHSYENWKKLNLMTINRKLN